MHQSFIPLIIFISLCISCSKQSKCRVNGTFSLPNGKKGYCREPDYCTANRLSKKRCPCHKMKQVCCVETGIAKGKCFENSKYVFTHEFTAALSTRRTLIEVSQCTIETPLIVGGDVAKEKEFPHMVAIGFGPQNKTSYLCGGSLISEQYVLTAAHCLTNADKEPARWAKLGAISLDEEADGDVVQVLEIIERIRHPKYQPPSRYHDIALFKLEMEVEMSSHVRPACLITNPLQKVSNATATGWGKLQYYELTGSREMMKVQLSIIEKEKCEKTFKRDIGGNSMPLGIIGSQLCAGHLPGGKDTCQGDSGGPLQISLNNPECMYGIYGITSFGKFCGFSNAPAIYTKVSYYIPWIESVIWSD